MTCPATALLLLLCAAIGAAAGEGAEDEWASKFMDYEQAHGWWAHNAEGDPIPRPGGLHRKPKLPALPMPSEKLGPGSGICAVVKPRSWKTRWYVHGMATIMLIRLTPHSAIWSISRSHRAQSQYGTLYAHTQ